MVARRTRRVGLIIVGEIKVRASCSGDMRDA